MGVSVRSPRLAHLSNVAPGVMKEFCAPRKPLAEFCRHNGVRTYPNTLTKGPRCGVM